MYSLPELIRLNALAVAQTEDELNYPRLHAANPRLHPLVAVSIRSIEEGRPLSEVQGKDQSGE